MPIYGSMDERFNVALENKLRNRDAESATHATSANAQMMNAQTQAGLAPSEIGLRSAQGQSLLTNAGTQRGDLARRMPMGFNQNQVDAFGLQGLGMRSTALGNAFGAEMFGQGNQLSSAAQNFAKYNQQYGNDILNGGQSAGTLPGQKPGQTYNAYLAEKQQQQNSFMPGVARGGVIGDVRQDTGRDTKHVKARPGEYFINPETVAEGFGGGDYEEGVRNLDQIVRNATGREPGPSYDGDEQQAAYGGAIQADPAYRDYLTRLTSQVGQIDPASAARMVATAPQPQPPAPQAAYTDGRDALLARQAQPGLRAPPQQVPSTANWNQHVAAQKTGKGGYPILMKDGGAVPKKKVARAEVPGFEKSGEVTKTRRQKRLEREAYVQPPTATPAEMQAMRAQYARPPLDLAALNDRALAATRQPTDYVDGRDAVLARLAAAAPGRPDMRAQNVGALRGDMQTQDVGAPRADMAPQSIVPRADMAPAAQPVPATVAPAAPAAPVRPVVGYEDDVGMTHRPNMFPVQAPLIRETQENKFAIRDAIQRGGAPGSQIQFDYGSGFRGNDTRPITATANAQGRFNSFSNLPSDPSTASPAAPARGMRSPQAAADILVAKEAMPGPVAMSYAAGARAPVEYAAPQERPMGVGQIEAALQTPRHKPMGMRSGGRVPGFQNSGAQLSLPGMETRVLQPVLNPNAAQMYLPGMAPQLPPAPPPGAMPTQQLGLPGLSSAEAHAAQQAAERAVAEAKWRGGMHAAANTPEAKEAAERAARTTRFVERGKAIGGAARGAVNIAKSIGPSAIAAGAVTGFGDYKIDDPEVDSSALGVLKNAVTGEGGKAWEGLRKGAVETGLDAISGLAKTVDAGTGLLGADQDLAGRFRKWNETNLGTMLKPEVKTIPGTANVAERQKLIEDFQKRGKEWAAAQPQGHGPGQRDPAYKPNMRDYLMLRALALSGSGMETEQGNILNYLAQTDTGRADVAAAARGKRGGDDDEKELEASLKGRFTRQEKNEKTGEVKDVEDPATFERFRADMIAHKVPIYKMDRSSRDAYIAEWRTRDELNRKANAIKAKAGGFDQYVSDRTRPLQLKEGSLGVRDWWNSPNIGFGDLAQSVRGGLRNRVVQMPMIDPNTGAEVMQDFPAAGMFMNDDGTVNVDQLNAARQPPRK